MKIVLVDLQEDSTCASFNVVLKGKSVSHSYAEKVEVENDIDALIFAEKLERLAANIKTIVEKEGGS